MAFRNSGTPLSLSMLACITLKSQVPGIGYTCRKSNQKSVEGPKFEFIQSLSENFCNKFLFLIWLIDHFSISKIKSLWFFSSNRLGLGCYSNINIPSSYFLRPTVLYSSKINWKLSTLSLSSFTVFISAFSYPSLAFYHYFIILLLRVWEFS